MTRLKPRPVGYAFGGFAAIVHLAWAVLVATGLAQPLIDLIFRLHFIEPPYRIAAFDASTAVLLVLVVSVVGFVAGYVLAVVWNVVVGRAPGAAAR